MACDKGVQGFCGCGKFEIGKVFFGGLSLSGRRRFEAEKGGCEAEKVIISLREHLLLLILLPDWAENIRQSSVVLLCRLDFIRICRSGH